jgi:paraquat-inducible protein B
MTSFGLPSTTLEFPAPRRPPRRTRRLPSPIWLVPVLALAVAAWLGARALWQRGTTITITFATAEGLEPHRTTIKYKNVDLGMVTAVELLDDRSGVLVTAELSPRAAPLLVEDARFWVVRPRVSPAGVTGIGTLLTGAHIGFDAGVSPRKRQSFTGLESPPTTIAGQRGRRFVLRADNIGSLDVGAPLYLRRFQVGRVTRVELDPGASGVVLEVFVDAPHDRHVTANTRFWNASGVDITVTGRGIKLDTQSIASVLAGGIAFQVPVGGEGGAPVAEGATFELFARAEAALRNPGTTVDRYRLVFDQSARGLAVGAPVELFGFEVGEVEKVILDLDTRRARARTVVAIAVQPDRLPGRASRPLFDGLVVRGLRAQLRTENVLTGQRYVAFDYVPGARSVRLAPDELPTVEGGADDLQGALTRLVTKLEKVPIAELAQEGTLAAREMRRTFEGTSRFMDQLDRELMPQMTMLMGRAGNALTSVEQTMSPEAPLQHELRSTLRDLSGAGHAVRTLAEYLERHPESLIRGKKED